MTVKRLIEILSKIENKETEIQIKNSYNPLGSISSLQQVEKTTYSFFGENVGCIILDTKINSDEEEYNDFVDSESTLYKNLNERIKKDNNKIIRFFEKNFK